MSRTETVNQILKGKDCNYGIRICKTIFEALQHAKLNVFEEWLQKEKKNNILRGGFKGEGEDTGGTCPLPSPTLFFPGKNFAHKQKLQKRNINKI